ncbi:neuferricin homolog [Trichoplusia ni]|uniref:Neuferricin homolog n=1 Tax=Trichoplusia ni TaxID=7111 RepID=A0A7E5V8R2_TRINI|nr:neuferricin homolog [Trichoplusia ni]
MNLKFINNKLFISLALVIISVIYRDKLRLYYESFVNDLNTIDRSGIFTNSKLAEYDGEIQKRLYLAVLGSVFDVTEGKTHYQKGASYNYFIGKDGSRALVTGNFKDESDEKDHVIDLSCNDLFTLVHWRNTYKKKYIEVGILIGRFYDRNGQETAYSREFSNKLKQCEQEKESSRKEKEKYPPCNISWSADEGTRVWCTTTSGGVKRSWVGVPRLLYTPGVENPRCACINVQEQDAQGLFKEYKNCPKSATECIVNN